MYTYVDFPYKLILLRCEKHQYGLDFDLCIVYFTDENSQSRTQDQYNQPYSVRLMDTTGCSRRNSKHADFWQNY